METKNAPTIIADCEFMKLLQDAKQKDPAAMTQLIDLYKEDILRLSSDRPTLRELK